jgi:hypothetical protein
MSIECVGLIDGSRESYLSLSLSLRGERQKYIEGEEMYKYKA